MDAQAPNRCALARMQVLSSLGSLDQGSLQRRDSDILEVRFFSFEDGTSIMVSVLILAETRQAVLFYMYICTFMFGSESERGESGCGRFAWSGKSSCRLAFFQAGCLFALPTVRGEHGEGRIAGVAAESISLCSTGSQRHLILADQIVYGEPWRSKDKLVDIALFVCGTVNLWCFADRVAQASQELVAFCLRRNFRLPSECHAGQKTRGILPGKIVAGEKR